METVFLRINPAICSLRSLLQLKLITTLLFTDTCVKILSQYVIRWERCTIYNYLRATTSFTISEQKNSLLVDVLLWLNEMSIIEIEMGMYDRILISADETKIQ